MADGLNLLPCPFCGDEAASVQNSYVDNTGFMALCPSCTAEGPLCNSEREAAEAWNHRATPPAPSTAPSDELPPLPKAGPICYAMVADIQEYKVPRVGKHLPGVYDAALWSTDQMRAYARAALANKKGT